MANLVRRLKRRGQRRARRRAWDASLPAAARARVRHRHMARRSGVAGLSKGLAPLNRRWQSVPEPMPVGALAALWEERGLAAAEPESQATR